MRVTLVTYDDAPPIGGQGSFVIGLRSALEDRGIDVTTIAGHGMHAMQYPRRSGRAPLDFSWFLRHHRKRVEETEPDCIHVMGGPGGVLYWRGRGTSTPLVYTATHTYRQAHGRGSVKRLLVPLERRAYLRADAVMAISKTTAAAVEGLGVPSNRIAVIPPGVPMPHGEGKSPASRFRDRTILFVGRLEEEKGVREAMDVMEEAARAFGAKGVIVGKGSLRDAVARRAQAGSALTYCGFVTDEELAQLYDEAAIVLMPSAYEGLGLVGVEGMVHGACLVAYDVDGVRDLGPSGCTLVPPGDWRGLLQACGDLLASEGSLSAASDAQRTWARSTYSWNAAAESTVAIYEAAIASAHSRAE